MAFSRRSRVGRSTSQGDIGMLTRVIPIDSVDDFFDRRKPTFPSAAKKPCKELERPVFTIGLPDRDEDLKNKEKKKQPGEGYLEFLQKCYLCKKALKKDVYMYGYLGAFCSTDCREDRMDLDGFNVEMAKEAKEMAEKYALIGVEMKKTSLARARFKLLNRKT